MADSERSCPAVVGESDRLTERIQQADGLFVGFDFDGTLAPIAADPDVPTISARLGQLVRQLSDRDDVRVAVVSGRELTDLVNRVGVDDVVYAGNHGLELYRDGERSVRPEVEAYQSTLRSVAETLQDRIDEIPGCQLENKRLSLTVHYRKTPTDRVDDVQEIVSETVPEDPEFDVSTGKEVFEVKPAVPQDKGTAMELLAGETPADWLTLYLGDDTTDEDAFEAIQPEGIGIHVGTNEETAAAYRIPSQEDVPEFVEWIASSTISTS